jgi:hypothetical protein
MGKPRPLLYYGDDQDQQAQAMLIEATGDGVSVENEEELLAGEFGAPNAEGIYGAPEESEELEEPEGSDD